MNEDVIWKPVVGFEGFYEISNNGLVRTVERQAFFGKRNCFVRSKIRKLSINAKGYYYVRLSNGEKQRNVLIHKALMEAFVPNPESKPYIDHTNTIKTDNRLENLRWVTSKENTQNPLTIKHITDSCSTEDCKTKQRNTKKRLSSNNYNPKKVFKYSLDGILLAEYESQAEAVKALGLNRNVIGNIKVALNNNHRSAYGFMWTTYKAESFKYCREIQHK